MNNKKQISNPPVCQWPECLKCVQNDAWGCKYHLFVLPTNLRARLQKAFAKRNLHTQAMAEYFEAKNDFKIWYVANSVTTEKSVLCDEVLTVLQDRYRYILNRSVTPVQWVEDRFRHDSISKNDSKLYLKNNHGITV